MGVPLGPVSLLLNAKVKHNCLVPELFLPFGVHGGKQSGQETMMNDRPGKLD